MINWKRVLKDFLKQFLTIGEVRFLLREVFKTSLRKITHEDAIDILRKLEKYTPLQIKTAVKELKYKKRENAYKKIGNIFTEDDYED